MENINGLIQKATLEFKPSRLLPSLTAGLVAGILAVILEISFAALIFSGDLAQFTGRGIGLTLFGAFALLLVVALGSSFPAMVAIPQDTPAAILAIMAATLAAGMTSASPEEKYATVVAAIVLTSLLNGLVIFALGSFKLGGLVRYIPYPVVGGFLAGTGWLLVGGAMGVLTGSSLSLANLPQLIRPETLLRWLPGLLFAVLLLAVLRRFSHFLLMPGMLMGAVGVFYLVLWILGVSVEQAGAEGWMLGPFPSGALWQPLGPAGFRLARWPLVFGQLGNIGTVIMISVVSLLLNASGVELSVRRDVDLNRELHAAGLANLLSGLGNGTTGFQTLSISVLGSKLGAPSRLVGITAALLCGATVLFGASVVSFFPKPVLGGLLMFLGLVFLTEWVYDAWFKFSKAEYLIVILILVAMAGIGVLEGVGIGIALAVVLFVFEYSRINVVKHSLSGTNFRSNVERPLRHQELLRQEGDKLYILKLNGMLFFGTANKLLEQVRQRVMDPALPVPLYIVLDFSQVSGLDASAALSFSKMKQVAQAGQITLVLTALSPAIQAKLARVVLDDPQVCHTFNSLDYGVEWCEDQLIAQAEDGAGLRPLPPPVQQMLEGTAGFHPYLARQNVTAGDVLIRQGEPVGGVYILESGQATVQCESEGQTLRIRKIGAGTVVGEIGMYLGTRATASVVIDEPGVVYRLSAECLQQMEQADPALAADFHKFITQILCERVLTTTDLVQALLE